MKAQVAILLACFNRKEKTLRSLASLFKIRECYNMLSKEDVLIDVYLTDDGSTDGTSEAVISTFPDKKINIIKADGNAYWAGGMRLAWESALQSGTVYDFYLLVNDDTELMDNCLSELFATHQYALAKYGVGGVYAGFVCDTLDETRITYGARAYRKGILHSTSLLYPIGVPQECSMTNANILLVCRNVVDSIGILDAAYIHGGADADYGIRAKKAGLPVLTTSSVCGRCANDHDSLDAERNKVAKMTFKQRKDFLNRPNTKQYHDSRVFFRRYNKIMYTMLNMAYFLNLYCPSVYYWLYKIRRK